MILTTRERWYALCQRFGIPSSLDKLIHANYDDLAEVYTAPGRYYHTLDHINDGLNKLDEIRSLHLSSTPDVIEMAWWFHDAIYDATSSVNEESSAKMANTALNTLGLSNELYFHLHLRIQVAELILATKHDLPPITDNGRLIVDIDLASLGTPPEIFDLNTANIRKEYAHVSDDDFARGRAGFFRKFLEQRPSIYLTEYFRNLYEAQAQKNLKRIIANAV